MKKARYVRVDVFSKRPFGGNPLAVFPEADRLTSREMQLLAREMNLSETTFVLRPSRGSGADFRVRIFTPDMEVPYAGHPTLGTFFVLAKEGMIRLTPPVTIARMEVKAGVLPVEIHSSRGKISKVVTVQSPPKFGRVFDDTDLLARALSLDEKDFDPTRMPAQVVSTGLPWLIAPVRSRAAVERANGNVSAFTDVIAKLPKGMVDIYVTCLQPTEKESTTHSRGFSMSGKSIIEDPATGSASGCLGAYLVSKGLVKTVKSVRIINEQGYEIGRPSKIAIEVSVDPDGEIKTVRVGGPVVHMMDGQAFF